MRIAVKDSSGLTATQNFTLTVSPVAVPNVQGLALEWAESLLAAAGLSTGTKTSIGGAISLNFDTLPSEQGWVYAGGYLGTPYEGPQGWTYRVASSAVPENQIFSVSNGVLYQNSIGAGFANEVGHRYDFPGVADKRLPFEITLRSRVLQEEGAFTTNSAGYAFGLASPPDQLFLIGLGTSRIEDQFTSTLAQGIDNTEFHDYLLVGTPGGESTFTRDGQMIAEGHSRTYPFASPTNYIQLGDTTAGTNAKAETAAYSFKQSQIATQTPPPGTLVKPASAVDLSIQDGPATQTVPDIVGQIQADAQNAIAAAGLLVGTLVTQASNVVPAGEVIKQKPVAGTHIMKDFKVDLIVSSGPVAGGACVAPSAGLVAWWSGDATAQDYVNANHGSALNGAAYQLGLVGSAFMLDGVDDHVRVPNHSTLQTSGPFTTEFWFKPGTDFTPQESTGKNHYFFAKGAYTYPGGLASAYGIDTANNDGRMEVNVSGARATSTQAVWDKDQWYHAAVTWDGAQYRLFIDGKEDDSVSNNASILNNAADIYLGWENNQFAHTPFNGLLDELSIYHRALAADEIQSIYNAGSYGKCKTNIVIADAGPDSSATTGEAVTLNGAASRDLSGKPITYAWALAEKPDGSFAELENATSATPSFVPDLEGDYLLRLTVNNGTKTSAPDTVKITAAGDVSNLPPRITSSPIVNATISTPYTYDVDATDPDTNDVLRYSLVDAPEGMSIDPDTGEIHWVPSSNAMLLSVDIATGNLVSIDPANGHVNVVGAIGQVVSDVDLAYLDRQLYAVSTFHSEKAELIKINEKTGLASFIAQLNNQNITVKQAEGLTQRDGKLFVSFAIDRDFSFSSQFGELGLTGNIVDDTSEMADADGLATSPSGTIFFVNAEPGEANYIGTVRPTETLGSYSTQFGAVNDLDFAGSTLFAISHDSANLHVIDSANGNLRVTIPLDRSGTYSGLAIPTANVTVKVTDRFGATDTQTFSINKAIFVSDGQSHPPTITSTAVLTAQTDFPYTYDVDATDPDTGDVLTYSLTGAPAGMVIDSASGLIQWTPTQDQTGSQVVTVKVQDKAGLSATQSFEITVSANQAPTITSTPPSSVKANKLYSYQITASDPDADDKLTYGFATGTPPGMTIDVDSGLLQWTSPETFVGVHHGIGVKVTDKGGLSATQTFDLTVLPANRAPVISSVASAVATENVAYSYAVQASDPDAGDTLTYSLANAPAGMAMDAGGVISWLPSSAQLGEHPVMIEVKDQEGLATSQDYLLKVEAATVSVPSIIGQTVAAAQAALTAAQLNLGGQTGAYDEVVPLNLIISQQPAAGVAVAKNSAVDVVISLGPAPVSVPSVLGMTEAAAESAIVAAKLTLGSKTSQYHDTIAAGLVIGQSPPPGSSVSKNSAVDLLISLGPAPVNVPGVVGMAQAAAEAAIVAANLALGAITTQASELVPAGAVISQAPPAGATVAKGSAVDLLVSSGPVPQPLSAIIIQPESPLLLTGEGLTLSALGILGDGSSQTLTGASWSSSVPAVATVDAAGNIVALTEGQTVISVQQGSISATTSVTVKAAATGDVTLPDAAITAPARDAVITTPTDIVGTAIDANFLKYELSLSPVGENNFSVFHTGTSAVNAGVLGVLDPTLLLNDQYVLRLTVWDRHNNTATTEVRVQIAREQKVGNFTLAFQDVNIPMACMPISVTRVYDSRDKRQGDFGVGWRLDVKTLQLRESREMGSGWHVDLVNKKVGFITLPYYVLSADDSHKVSLTLPDGQVEEFDMAVSPSESQLYPLGTVNVSYAPRPGTLGSLAPVGPTSWDLSGDTGSVELIDSDINPFDPQQYVYTAPDGSRYLIDKTGGVQNVSCANGQSLTFAQNGISHSDGSGVGFTRDAQGRITAITDPNGNTQTYSYNAAGDLVKHSDPVGNNTGFKYDYRHGLLNVIDPRGVQAVRNEYDAAGRLLGNTDAAGQKIVYHHDLVNKTETITDRLGNSTFYDYDAQGNVIHQVDALGNETVFTYDSVGNQLSKTDALGRTTTQDYDSRRNVLKETDPLGNVTRYTYHALNGVKTITDALGRVTGNDYDASGNLLSSADPLGAVTTYGYDKGGIVYPGSGLMTSKTDALGNVTRYNYDAQGRLSAETDAKGNVTTYAYDANGNRIQEQRTRTVLGVGVETLTTTFEYDALNRLVKTTHPDGSTSRTVYNAIGKQAQTLDAEGRISSYDYDELGHLVKTTYPDGASETSSYDAEGRRIASTDRAGRTTSYSYDALGRLVQTTYPDGTSSGTSYDAVGQVVASTDTEGHVTQYQYDAAGRRTKVIDALGHETVFTYDAAGNQTSITDANGHVTQFVYDNANRRTEVVYPDGSKDQTGYDALGRNISKTDQANITTQFAFDALGRLIKVTDALNQVTSYGYDELGNQLSQTDANGHSTMFAYDNMGRRVSRTLPEGQTETMAYDISGNLTGKTDFNGHTTTLSYDELNRLLEKTPDPALNEPAVVFSYTASGQRASMQDASGLTSYQYDERDRLTEKATPQGTLTYSYNGAGLLAGIHSEQAAGVNVSYGYDALNRLATVTDHNLGDSQTVYGYDNVGNLAAYQYANGVEHRYSYNSLNRLQNLQVGKGATDLAAYAYTLGPSGNRLSVAELGGRTVHYVYDALYRLQTETIAGSASHNGQIGYVYDPVGNRLNRSSTVAGIAPQTFSYNGNDQLASDQYDANGNTIGSDGQSYRYDSDNRLTDANGGAVKVVYDGDGNRVSKTVAGVTTTYLVDSLNPTGYAQVLEERGNGQVAVVYGYGLDLISQNRKAGSSWTASYYGYDGHGSVRILTDAAGNITDTYDYDAFGILIGHTGSTVNSYLYSGEQRDSSLGLDYLRARYLSIKHGRFINIDTYNGNIFEPKSLHKFLYVYNGPIDNIDPTGYSVLIDTIIATAIVAVLFKTSSILIKDFRAIKGKGMFVPP